MVTLNKILVLALVSINVMTVFSQNFTWEYYDGPGGPGHTNFDTIAHPLAFGSSRFGSVSYGDLDNDGDKDFISGSRIGEFYFYRNIGTPTLPKFLRESLATLDTINIAPNNNINECRPKLVDIDNDGDLDLFVTSRYDYNGYNFFNDIHFYENIGSPTNPVFQYNTNNVNGLQNQNVAEFVGLGFADMDADGDLDLVAGGSDSCTYFENIGSPNNPSFDRKYGINNPFDNWSDISFLAPTLSLKDMDRDGDYDLFFGNEAGFVRMVENIGTPTNMNWGTGIPTVPGYSHLDTVDFGRFIAIDIEDVNNDGWEDVTVCSFQPSYYYMYLAHPNCSDDVGAFSISSCGSYTVPSGDETYTSSGVYMDTIPTVLGCDSVLTITVTINSNATATDMITNCDSYVWRDGNTYTVSNSTATYVVVGAATNGCDSVYTLNLTINNSNTGIDTQIACDSYTWIDGNTYTSSNNTATHTLTNMEGCDSVVTLNLTINNSNTGIDTQVACDSYTWIDGNTYTSSNNTAMHTLTNVAGCDSVVTLNLTINNSSTGVDSQVACNSFTWIDGNTYTASNNSATHTLTNTAGCDSVVTLNLTINNSNTGTDTQFACNSYTWIDGNTYTTSNNTATYTLTNVHGCDSVVTLNLTINSVINVVDVQVACDSYTWIDGNTYTVSNNTATHTLQSVQGCDSVITLDLTINSSTVGVDTQVACDSYTWIDGNTYTSSNNTATYTLTNAIGCDSIVTLDLTINSSSTGIDTQVACDSYTWINGVTYTVSNNTATHTLTNAAGCDSVVTLDLTINNSNTGIDTQVACLSYTWINGVTYTTSNNTATHTLTNSSGCDSVVMLNLTINTSVSVSMDTTICYGSIYNIGNSNYSAAGTYVDTILSTTGCDSIVTSIVTVENQIDTYVERLNTVYTVNQAGAQYQWIDCNDNYAFIANATNQTYTASQEGSYAVIVSMGVCKDTSICEELPYIVSSADKGDFSINVYPNPVQGENLRIDLTNNISVIELSLRDNLGKVVYKANIDGVGNFNLPMGGFENGVYLLEVKSNEVSEFVKVIKQ